MKNANIRRFEVTRTVTNKRGISAEIELDAIDAADAERKAQNLFAHETGAVATYTVRIVR